MNDEDKILMSIYRTDHILAIDFMRNTVCWRSPWILTAYA